MCVLVCKCGHETVFLFIQFSLIACKKGNDYSKKKISSFRQLNKPRQSNNKEIYETLPYRKHARTQPPFNDISIDRNMFIDVW